VRRLQRLAPKAPAGVLNVDALRGGFDGGTYKKAADGLIAAWDTTQAAIEAQTAFAIEQADKRVQAFLTGSDSA
jgi:hypothetical protein